MIVAARRQIVVVFAVAALGSSLLAACAAGGERTGFDSEPAQAAPTSDPPPAKTSQSSPSAPTGDASAPDASNCKTTAPSNKCGVVPQCGCTLAQTCDVVDSKGNAECVTAGTAAMGQPCTATSGCKVGLTCMFGTCRPFCDTVGSACSEPGTGSCIQVQASGGTPVTNMLVCLVSCALENPTSCGGTTAAGTGVCKVDNKGATDCEAGGTRQVNQSCNDALECGPGLVCVGPAGQDGTCKKWCRVSTNDCGGSTACLSFTTKLMVGTQEYGACP